MLGSRTTEPVATDQNVMGQTALEQPMPQPTAISATEMANENPAQAKAETGTPTWGDETAGTPPPSSVAGEEDKTLSSAPVEESRAPSPSPAPVEAPTQAGTSDRGKGPMIPINVVGGSAGGEEAPAASDVEVEEIQGRPHDGCQHIYVWRQRGDH